MTKVEELRKNLVSELYAFNMTMFRESGGADEEVDSLIAAAELQGVEKGRTEGAEQERERIRKASPDGCFLYSDGAGGAARACIIPISVFMSKEAANDKQG
jgi:hypothetical protein